MVLAGLRPHVRDLPDRRMRAAPVRGTLCISLAAGADAMPLDNLLAAFTEQMAAPIEALGRHVVAVQVGRHECVSGTLWRAGTIVTVAHALRHAGDVPVVLPDGSPARAHLAGIDASTDLAALRAEAGAFEPAPLGDDASIRIGHWVCAVARGPGGELAADQGIVGRTGGAWQTWRGGRIDRLIRLDGGLQSGFSGAPIAAAHGRVIGIATAALARGYGIVIPARTVNRVVDALLAHGRVAHGYLGVGIQTVELPAPLARELEVLRLLAGGLADKRIAERLGISEHTAKFHVGRVLAKVDAATRAEAVAIGLRDGLIGA
jgi:S1-C subfamily serine protease